jgi:hypothetical protein
MKKGERFLITTEQHRLTVLRRGASSVSYGSCEICGPTVLMVSVDEAVALSGIRTGEIVAEAETGSIHSREAATGHLSICSRSLRELPTKPSEHMLRSIHDEEKK